MDITAPPSWLLAEYRPSMDITAPPSWLLAEYRPSMDIKKEKCEALRAIACVFFFFHRSLCIAVLLQKRINKLSSIKRLKVINALADTNKTNRQFQGSGDGK